MIYVKKLRWKQDPKKDKNFIKAELDRTDGQTDDYQEI